MSLPLTALLHLHLRTLAGLCDQTVPTAVISTRLDTGRYGFIGEVESCSSTTPGFMGRFNYTGANIVQTAAPAAPPNPPTTSLRIRSRWDVKNPGQCGRARGPGLLRGLQELRRLSVGGQRRLACAV